MKKILFSVLIIFFTAIPVSAQGIEHQYTEKIENILSEYSINFEQLKEYPFETLWDCVKKSLGKPFDTSLDVFYRITAILLITAFINFFTSDNNAVAKIINMVAALVMFHTMFNNFENITQNVSNMLIDVKNFITTFLPVFAGITFASGEFAASAVYSGFFLVMVISVADFCVNYIVPSVNLYLAVGVTTQVSSIINLKPLCELYSKSVKVVMTAVVSVLCFVLSLQNVIAQGKDGLLLKAGRFFVTSTVPIIGSALESAVGSVYTSMGVLKSFCGLAGIAVIVSIFIPHIAVLSVNWICCQFMIAAGGILENIWAQELLTCFKEVIEIMLSMCVLFLILLVFSITMMIKVIGFG